jgi:hypothetical protein
VGGVRHGGIGRVVEVRPRRAKIAGRNVGGRVNDGLRRAEELFGDVVSQYATY